MKVTLVIDLQAETPEEAQNILEGVRAELERKNLIAGYRYEIETPDGPVTERCVLADGEVIA